MPNNDLISRKELLENFEWLKSQAAECSRSEIDSYIERIKNAPAVDAEPVIHSNWVMIPVNYVARYRCGNLNCARLLPFGCVPNELPRCPTCGAKMDKEKT